MYHRRITQRLPGALEKGLAQSVFLVKSCTREVLSLLLSHVKQISSSKKIHKISTSVIIRMKSTESFLSIVLFIANYF